MRRQPLEEPGREPGRGGQDARKHLTEITVVEFISDDADDSTKVSRAPRHAAAIDVLMDHGRTDVVFVTVCPRTDHWLIETMGGVERMGRRKLIPHVG